MLIQFPHVDRKWLRPFEDKLDRLVTADIGELDGHEVGLDGSDGKLYLYGPSAKALWARIEKVVRAAPFMRGATVLLRYGPPGNGVRGKTIVLK